MAESHAQEASVEEVVEGQPSAADVAGAQQEGESDSGEYNGDLPDFSDEEKQASTSRKPLVPKPKGPPGAKKKLPFSKLRPKASPAASSPAASASPSAAQASKKSTGKGIQMSEEMLDNVMAQLRLEKGSDAGSVQRDDVRALIDQMGINQKMLQGREGFMGKGTKDTGSHKFWATQPVPKFTTPAEEIKEGPLEGDKPLEEIRKTPHDLHSDFRWVTMNLADANELKEVYDLLTNHYVEDNDATFRFDYAAEFIQWALQPPGYVADWHVGIRVAKTGKLVGFIAGVPMDTRIRNVTKAITEINFLVVHKKLRQKRLAPLLIKEVTRRSHLKGIFQAIYTAGVLIPTPIARCQYYHRSLNPKKLTETGFSPIPRNSTLSRMMRMYKLPEETSLPGLRELEKRDLKQVGRLLRAYLARMDLAPLLSNKDVEHAVYAGRGKDVDGKRVGQVTWSYVIEDQQTHRITDFFCFYALPSQAVKMKPATNVNAAYLYYYATTSCPSCSDLGDGSVATPVTHWKDETEEERRVLKERLNAVIGDALILALRAGFDVFNALTLQDNVLFLEDQKFGRGDGFLHYYLYNYATKPILGGIDSSDGGSGVGVVML